MSQEQMKWGHLKNSWKLNVQKHFGKEEMSQEEMYPDSFWEKPYVAVGNV